MEVFCRVVGDKIGVVMMFRDSEQRGGRTEGPLYPALLDVSVNKTYLVGRISILQHDDVWAIEPPRGGMSSHAGPFSPEEISPSNAGLGMPPGSNQVPHCSQLQTE